MRYVVGFEGLYSVTRDGTIIRLPREVKRANGNTAHLPQRTLKPRSHPQGYLKIILSFEGIQYQYYIHRLVAEAYIPNPHNKKQVNHKNLNKRDNRVENLEWVTSKENVAHQIENGVHVSVM